MAVAGPDLVGSGIPVVGQFEHRVGRFVAVADESQRKSSVRIVGAPQLAHAEHLSVEGKCTIEVADAQHGMKYSHGNSSAVWPGFQMRGTVAASTLSRSRADW
jgi:hypothetical protein